MVGGGGWWANPLQTLSQGLVLTLRFVFGPELDKKLKNWISFFISVSLAAKVVILLVNSLKPRICLSCEV